ncbi:MAG: carboxy terminal-processing peptidase [Cyclobacteriaceae bacterium]
MKISKRKINILFIIASFTILISCFSFRNSSDKRAVVLQLVTQALEKEHYSDRKLDDEFSKHVFKSFINSLDYSKSFFTQKDIQKLKKYETEIDDQLLTQNFTFFNEAVSIIDERIKGAEELYKKIVESPFNFKKKETYEVDVDKRAYPRNNKEWKDAWRKQLKYQALSRLYTATELQLGKKESKDSTYTEKTFAELEEDARTKTAKSNSDLFTRLYQLTEKDRFSQYVNAITEGYDPHTTYYPPKEKENFDISMTGRLEGIGATLQQKDGYIKVVKIVPGSASWKQGELEEGHLILKVAQGAKEPVDVVGMRLDDAVQLIRGKKGTEVRLTVKRIDGTIGIIPIIRDVVILEATYAKSSVILFNENKYGYIKLPKFYADFSGKGGRNCGEDVRKELEKLKAENVEGVILDLRNNGGGSLNEVVEMTGLFIPTGPVVQVKSNSRPAYVLRDNNSSVTYKGPLIVLVNEFSASASEILAAAIQDYGRGVIIGTGSTHGKGTVQRIIDLDAVIRGNKDLKPLGAMKLTTQKFYRINGGATQLKGVTPDIMIPDKYSYLKVGEKELDFALEWDKIASTNYSQDKALQTALNQLKLKSDVRVKEDSVLQAFDTYAKYLAQERDRTVYSLSYDSFSANQEKSKQVTDQYNKMRKSTQELTVFTTQEDRMLIASDTTQKAGYETFNKNTRKDYYLFEPLRVMSDMISH